MLNIPKLSKANLRLLINSVKYKGGIVTGGECKTGCKYCYLRESRRMASCIPLNIPFISYGDFKKAVFTAKKYKHKAVSLGDGVDMISSEPFIHPLIYNFIEELESCNFIDEIVITTSGLYVERKRYELLRKSRKIGWVISCGSLSEDGRKNLFSMRKCAKLLDFLSVLHNANAEVYPLQLVPYSLKYFIKDIEIIRNNFPDFLSPIYVRELGYNKFFSKKAKSFVKHCQSEFKKVLEYCSKKKLPVTWDDSNLNEGFDLKCKFDYFKGTLNDFIEKINKALVYCVSKNFKAPLLCIPDSCFSVLPRVRDSIILPKFKKGYLRVENKTFGGNYKCYGLLTLDDFSHALKKVKLKNYDVVLLNGIFLNRDSCDLKGRHINELTDAFKIPVVVRE